MVASLKSLVIPLAPLPTVDTSWLGKLTSSAGDALDKAGQTASIERNVIPAITGQPAQQQPSFLGRLFGGQQQAAAPQASAIPAPAAQAQMGAGMSATAPNGVKQLISQYVPPEMQQYATNLIGKESAFNPSAVSPTGAKGLAQFTTGTGKQYGLVTDQGDARADPVANLKAFVALTNDNRNTLTQALGRPPTDGELALAHQQGAKGAIDLLSGKSVPGQNLAVNGVDPGTDPRAAAQKIMSYYGGSGGDSAQVASLDPSIGMGGAGQQVQASSPAPQPAQYVDPQVTTAGRQGQPAPQPVIAAQAPQQVEQAQQQPASNILAAAQPVSRQNISNDQIAAMVRDPNTRQIGLQLWQQVLGKAGGEPWQFVTLPDGTLARANQQTGAVEKVGQFAKPQDGVTNVNGTLVRNADGGVVYRGGPDTTVLTADEKKALGLPDNVQLQRDGSGKVSQIGNPGTTVNVDNGTIPPGFQADRDANGRIQRLVPIPGGPADTTKPDKIAADNRDTLTDVVTTAAQRARDAIKEASLPTEGIGGRAAGVFPSTSAAEVRRQVGVLKSNATIEALNAMRAASKTGGALGSVTESEEALLAAKAGALDPDSPTFERDLDDYEHTLLRTVHGKTVGDQIFDHTRKAPASKSDNVPTPPAPEDVDPTVWDAMTPGERALWQN